MINLKNVLLVKHNDQFEKFCLVEHNDQLEKCPFG